MKLCTKCQKKKPVDQFTVNKKAKDGLHYYCKGCVAGLMRLHYARDPKTHNQRLEVVRQALLKEVQEIKHQAGCKFCPEREPVCLDFHHLASSEKEATIANLVSRKNRTKVLEEISKCIVVCSNCHRKIHAGLLNGVTET